MKVESIASDDRNRPKREVVGYIRVLQDLFARPLVDASRARACPPQLSGRIFCLEIVRPEYRNLTVGLLDYLQWLDHMSCELTIIQELLDLCRIDPVMGRVIDRLAVTQDERLRRLVPVNGPFGDLV